MLQNYIIKENVKIYTVVKKIYIIDLRYLIAIYEFTI